MKLFSNGMGNKRMSLVSALILTLMVTALAGAIFVNLTTADPIGMKPIYYKFTILSPESETSREHASLKFTVKTNWANSYRSFCFTLDASGKVLYGPIWNDFLKVEENIVNQVEISTDSYSPGKFYYPYVETTYECTANLAPLSYGKHSITIYRGYNFENEKAAYSNLYRFSFTVVDPPQVSVVTPQNLTYDSSDVPLRIRVFTHSLSWLGYSLDGKGNVTINIATLVQHSMNPSNQAWTGNLTLNGLASGLHSLKVYASDTLGNEGLSETLNFRVAQETQETEFSPPIWIAVAIVASVAIIGFGLLAYFVKFKRKGVK